MYATIVFNQIHTIFVFHHCLLMSFHSSRERRIKKKSQWSLNELPKGVDCTVKSRLVAEGCRLHYSRPFVELSFQQGKGKKEKRRWNQEKIQRHFGKGRRVLKRHRFVGQCQTREDVERIKNQEKRKEENESIQKDKCVIG